MKNVLKWIGILVGGLILIVVLYGGYIYMQAGSIMSKTYPDVQGKNIYVVSDSATIERGRHLAASIGTCAGCHGSDLSGYEVSMGPFAYYSVSNITQGKGGLPPNYTIQELDLIVRHGIKRDKTGVLFMPSFHLNNISDEDLAAIFAYLKVAPKVDKERPPLTLGPIGKMVLVKGGLVNQAEVTDHSFKSPKRPEIAPTKEYGKYLTEITCIGCHAPNYTGGPVFEGDPNWPPAPNLTKILKNYTHESFVHLLKTGLRPDGTKVDSTAMPTAITSLPDSAEVAAIWNYLSALAPREDASTSWHDVLTKH